MGEEAVDAGGVRKEFFLLMMKELLDPKYGMFRYYEDSRLIWFAHKVFDSLMMILMCVSCKCEASITAVVFEHRRLKTSICFIWWV